MAHNVFSIDLEDWFHLLDTASAPPIGEWVRMESRVVRNTHVLLDLLAKYDTRATFFVLGWVAEQHPGLVREIAEAGHEVASHGHSHQLVFRQSPLEFEGDLCRASDAIVGACGARPKGYRAPGFSIMSEQRWAFDVLARNGYEYDSSVFPARRGHGGMPGAHHLPWEILPGLHEYPVSTVDLGIGRLAYLGGGYLRCLPSNLILRFAHQQSVAGVPLILYVHPRDIDPGQPRLKLSRARQFKSYVGLGTGLEKLRMLLSEFAWGSFERANMNAPCAV